MRILRFLWRRITSLAITLLFLLLLLALYVGANLLRGVQQDDSERLAGKREYLAEVQALATPQADRPNIVLVLYDDLGYGDIGPGSQDNLLDTPQIDALAAGGVSLTDFHSPAPVCTPSRAGILTGRLPMRAGLPHVVFPTDSPIDLLSRGLLAPGMHTRLPAEEITLAEVLGAAGYNTGMVGKWHLGDRSPSLPNDMGFEEYYGALYSNDMTPFALYRDRDIAVESPVDQDFLTEHYTREAVAFIERDRDTPFFLYFAHNFPHDPLHVRDERSGNSRAGLYGDVLAEIDDGIGDIVAALQRTGQYDNTLVMITSDNGPWFLGDAGDQRGAKGSTFEGGMRVPFIAHWPAGIPGGRVEDAMAMGTDLFPTVLDLLQLPAPEDREIDGRSILPVLSEGAATPHEFLYYYDGTRLFAVRDERFKYRGEAPVHYGTDSTPVAAGMPQKAWLFDLAGDPREAYDTSDHYPEALARLERAYNLKNMEMAGNPRGWRSSQIPLRRTH